jgi:hypothetical protein
MKVLILGANGYLGPHVVKALEPHHELRITDIKPPAQSTRHEFRLVDVASLAQVREAAKGMDAIINLSVLRSHRQLAFDVNARGCYNMMLAAVEHGIRRIINTGPHFTVAGHTYEGFDFGITPDAPPQPGTNLYALTKSLGQEICRVFTRKHDLYVQDYLFYSLRDMASLKRGTDATPFSISWGDAGEIFRLGLEIDLAKLPSPCEIFFVFADMPHGQFVNEKAKRILGFRPADDLSVLWRKAD